MIHAPSHREGIKTAGLGVAGLGLLHPSISQASKPMDKKVEMAIATITMDGFGDMNFEKAFEILPQLPFKNVEFNCWYGRNLTQTGIQSIRERCAKNNLKPICVQGSSFGASGNIIKDITHKLWKLPDSWAAIG